MPTNTAHLVALDVDGTIVTHDDYLPEENREAVARALADGHHIVVSTGRALKGTVEILDRLGLESGYVVTSNGAVASRFTADRPGEFETVVCDTFDSTRVVDMLTELLPTASIAVELEDSTYLARGVFGEQDLRGDVSHVTSTDEMRGKACTRVSLRGSTDEEHIFAEAGKKLGIEGVTFALGGTMWLDLGPEGVSKASGLEHVRSALGVPPGAVWAAGDGSNDLSMLRWASRSFAMANGNDAVKAAATEVAGDVADAAVARILAQLPTPS